MLSAPRPPHRVLVARLDNLGDVLLSGPAVRAVAASGAEVVYLCSPQGRPAAAALPGVTRVVTARVGWIDARPRPVTPSSVAQLVTQLGSTGCREALILTSFHQSPLPLALALRAAGFERLSAISVDYPGSLLDLRHLVDDDIHEVERGLSLAAAAGYHLPAGDDRRLRLALASPTPVPDLPPGYVVVHPGASVPARAWPAERSARLVAELAGEGRPVVVTGGPGEAALVRAVVAAAPAGSPVVDLAGATDFATLARVVAGARAVICGNTGPAHLAAAVGTPVVSLYAPTVPARRWRPWMVPHTLLGEQDIGCAGCRARVCPVAGHPCLSRVEVADVIGALGRLVGETEGATR